MLEIEVTRKWVLIFDGKEIKPPKEWLDKMLEKHNKVLEVKKKSPI